MELFPDTFTELLIQVMGVLFAVSPIWVPLLLVYVFYTLWMTYINLKKIQEMEFIMLEVKLPREISRSPAAMEIVLSAFWQSDPANNFIKKYIEGKVMSWSSLELVSIGGEVHFFIRVEKKQKNVVEARIYSQYPNVEIYEVPDYTEFIEFNPEENNVWGTEYALAKADPYPIKTYVDYGLHTDPKEEFKIDPITPLIEFLGSIGKDEQVWHQILIRKHDARRGRRSPFKKTDWKDDAKEIVKKAKEKGAKEGEFMETRLTEAEKTALNAIERSITKTPFEVGIRSIYVAPKEVFNPGPNISGLFGSFFQVNSQNLNGFKPNNVTDIKYPWQDYKDIRINRMRKEIFEAYKKRAYFYPPYKKKWFVLNTEELATIYHFPGDVSQTPTFGRIGSRKAEPPTNLPV